MMFRSLLSSLSFASVSVIAGCYVGVGDHRHPDDPPYSSPPPANTPQGEHVERGIARVEVETDQVMDVVPGEGVGFFVEYKRGGHWRVWWSADTNRTGAARTMAMRVTSQDPLQNVASEGFSNGDALETEPGWVMAETTATKQALGIRFDTTPGAPIVLEVAVDGLRELPGFPTLLFFVQDGLVNGGHTGKIQNPLTMQPKSP